MRIDRRTLVFIDAACWIAATGSPNGGSGFMLALCQAGFLRAAATQVVLLEARRNIVNKMGIEALQVFHRLLFNTPLQVLPVPPDRADAQAMVGEKDDHVLAAALAAGAAFLLTLDRPLIKSVNAAGLPIRAITPGHFIKELLPTHPDYPQMR